LNRSREDDQSRNGTPSYEILLEFLRFKYVEIKKRQKKTENVDWGKKERKAERNNSREHPSHHAIKSSSTQRTTEKKMKKILIQQLKKKKKT
jgi:hypothetical protein